ncbi:MAG: DUF2764 family protein [Rikenellaceae bacterium]
MANYHYIISSLIDYSFDTDPKGFDAEKLCEELKTQLSDSDWNKLGELWWFFDLRNILDLRSDRKGVYSPFSNLTESEVKLVNRFYTRGENLEIEEEELPVLPNFAVQLLTSYKDDSYAAEREISTSEPIDNKIWSAYYDFSMRSHSQFIRDWSEFDLNVKNISAAYTAREKGINIEDVVIGDNEITRLILRNENVQDFGLKNEFSEIDQLLHILQEKDMLAKERNLDKLRIKKIDDLVTFDYFNLEFILGYMVKISMIVRWSGLSARYGREVLTSLTNQLTSKDVLSKVETII